MSEHDFAFVDVFADRPLQGNALPVVPAADALSGDERRGIAREFNQPETTFISRPTRDGADYRLQSFTAAGHEVVGAGHNALGAWLWLSISGVLPAGRSAFVQQLGDRLLNVTVRDGGSETCTVTLTQAAPEFLARVDDGAALAGALGLPVDAIQPPGTVVSTGVPHLLVPLRDRETVDAAQPSPAELAALLAAAGAQGAYVFTTAGASGVDAYARFFNPTVGIWEDPATGSAAGPLAAHLARSEQRSLVIEQGTKLGRRSLLQVDVAGDAVRLSGRGVITISGRLHL